jgi:nucleoside-diphosphate-sugar epimerase
VGSQQRVLLTGHRGYIGRWLSRSLRAAGHSLKGFDVLDGQDLLDETRVVSAAAEVDVIVHAAARLADDPTRIDSEAEALAQESVRAAKNVLFAAEAGGHSRVIVFSSPQALGIFDGERPPRSFPIREDHPLLASRPYGRSKTELELLCGAFSERTGITSVCLRPLHVWLPGHAADVRAQWLREPAREWLPHWNFGAFVDVRDLCEAVKLSLRVPLAGHRSFLLCAADIASTLSTREAAARWAPGVPMDRAWERAAGSMASLVDASEARALLGWQPRHTWAVESRLHRVQRAWGRLRRVQEFGWL